MKATTLLLDQRERVQELIRGIRKTPGARDRFANELVDSVAALMMLEHTALQLLEWSTTATSRQRQAHDRARALLYHIVTADSANRTVDRRLQELAGVFTARSDELRMCLAGALDDRYQTTLGSRLQTMLEQSSSRLSGGVQSVMPVGCA